MHQADTYVHPAAVPLFMRTPVSKYLQEHRQTLVWYQSVAARGQPMANGGTPRTCSGGRMCERSQTRARLPQGPIILTPQPQPPPPQGRGHDDPCLGYPGPCVAANLNWRLARGLFFFLVVWRPASDTMAEMADSSAEEEGFAGGLATPRDALSGCAAVHRWAVRPRAVPWLYVADLGGCVVLA